MKALYSVDNQNDFYYGGNLAVPDADLIKTNINKLYNWSKKNKIDLFGSMDAHDHDDDEFKMFPPHCIIFTRGYDLIKEIDPSNIVIIGTNYDLKEVNNSPYFFEKATYNIWDEELGNSNNIDVYMNEKNINEVIVFGVVTEICVNLAILGFVERGIKVNVVEDAIMHLDIEKANQCKENWKEKGVVFFNTKDIING